MGRLLPQDERPATRNDMSPCQVSSTLRIVDYSYLPSLLQCYVLLMAKHIIVEKTRKRSVPNVPIVAGRLCVPVVIVILAVLASLAVLLRHYR